MHDAVWWSRRATVVGWLALVGYFGVVLYLVERVRDLSRFEAPYSNGFWDQRLEVLSFAALPQQSVLLLVAAIVGALAGVLAARTGTSPPVALSSLLVVTLVTAAVSALVAVASVVDIVVRDGSAPDRWGDIYLRAGGTAVVAAAGLLAWDGRRQRSPSTPSR